MITLVSILFLGFFLGMRHATDSDHVVAVTTIVSRQSGIREAALVGVFWGIGHSLTLLVVGGAIVGLGLVVPEKLGLSLELCVSVMLVLLGVLNLRGMFKWFRDVAGGDNLDDRVVVHLDRRFDTLWSYLVLRPLIIGVVHGLAGSAAVALLVLPVIQSPASAMAYLLIFGAGTIAGMLLITAAIAVPMNYAAARSRLFQRYVGAGAGLCSIGFGLFLFWHIGFAQGLFLK